MRIPPFALLLACTPLAACDRSDESTPRVGAGSVEWTAERIGTTDGLAVPEAARFDGELDVWFVSTINGNPSARDNNGAIVIVQPDAPSAEPRTLVAGGQGGATLHAPKGMAIRGDTLWVADIDVLRAFDKRTGVSLGDIPLTAQRATFLNDIAARPDGLYITDTGISFDTAGAMSHHGTDRIFHVGRGVATDIARGELLSNPNGIAWDDASGQWILAPFAGRVLQSLAPGDSIPTPLATGPGGYDGVLVLPGGTILVTSWNANAVMVLQRGDSVLVPLISGVAAPASIGYDPRRQVLAVPLFNDGRVEFYRLSRTPPRTP
jgi:sugar lactone lactonase YvrE